MKYNELSREIKMSFQKTLENYIFEYVNTNDYEKISRNFITKKFMRKLIKFLTDKEVNSHQKWAKSEFKIDKKEIELLVYEKVERMRKKKISEKQKEYFTNMIDELKLNLTMPNDYLVFCSLMNDLKEVYWLMSPATEKQISSIKNVWFKKFKEDIVFEAHPQRVIINNLFELINIYEESLYVCKSDEDKKISKTLIIAKKNILLDSI